MRGFFAALAALLALVAGSTYYTHAVQKAASAMESRVEAAARETAAENWDGARAEIEALKSEIGKHEGWLSLFINEKTLQRVGETLARAKGYIELENREEALVSCAALTFEIQFMKENESFNLKNLL
jgi:Flp pilus assembly protein TadG